MYIYVYIYILNIFIFTVLCMYINMYVRIHIYIYMYTYIHVCMYTSVCMYIHMCKNIYACVYIYICIYLFFILFIFLYVQNVRNCPDPTVAPGIHELGVSLWLGECDYVLLGELILSVYMVGLKHVYTSSQRTPLFHGLVLRLSWQNGGSERVQARNYKRRENLRPACGG